MSHISAQEQYLIELINRARLDPLAEAGRQGVSLNDGLAAGTITEAQKSPLAPNAFLAAASETHSNWMLATDVFSHTGAGGSSPDQRIVSAGYDLTGNWSWGENLAWYGTTGRLNLSKAIDLHHSGLYNSASHRENIFGESFQEVGVAQVKGQFSSGGTDFNASMLTQSYGSTGSSVFITGVAYQDRSRDGFYSIGEGRGNIKFSVNGGEDVTGKAGGYALSIAPGGPVEVTISAGRKASMVRVDTSGGNVKLDVVGRVIASSSDLDLLSGARHGKLLGINDTDLTGNVAANWLLGNSGDNTILGHGRNDKIRGNDGDDTLDGGTGRDVLWGGNGDDALIGGYSHDRLFGGAGADRIDGGHGRDRMVGGDDADVFVFADGYGRDAIMDFDGVGDADVIDLTLLTSIVDFTDLMTSHVHDTRSGLFITAGADRLFLKGLDQADLQVDDFLFV